MYSVLLYFSGGNDGLKSTYDPIFFFNFRFNFELKMQWSCILLHFYYRSQRNLRGRFKLNRIEREGESRFWKVDLIRYSFPPSAAGKLFAIHLVGSKYCCIVVLPIVIKPMPGWSAYQTRPGAFGCVSSGRKMRESGRGKRFWFPFVPCAEIPMTMATCARIVTSLSKIKCEKKGKHRDNQGPDV